MLLEGDVEFYWFFFIHLLPFPFQLNPTVNTFQRKYVNEVKKCEEMERILGKRMFVFAKMQCSFSKMSCSRAVVRSCIPRVKFIRLNSIWGATGLTVMRDVSCCLLWFEAIFGKLVHVWLDLEEKMLRYSKQSLCCCWKHTDGIWTVAPFIIVCVCLSLWNYCC